MKSENFTVIVSQLSCGLVRKFVIPRKLATGVSFFIVVLLTTTVLCSLHYYYMWNQSKDYDRLKAEVTRLRKQNQTFRLAAKQLTDRLSSIEVSTQKLRIESGLEDGGMGGVGGPSPGYDAVLALDDVSLYNHFRSLERKSISLQSELRRLQEYYKDRGILMAATPAILPVRGYPNDRFGYRNDPFTGGRDFHPGIDISAPYGNKVIATADGVVQSAGRQVGYGKMVMLRHRFGIATLYGHLSRITVSRGQEVRKGDVIGYVGSTGRATGPHVHYEVRLNGRPLDPTRFLSETE